MVSLSALVKEFPRNIPASARLIRELLERNRGRFLADALKLLRREPGSRGAQYVLGLLLANRMILGPLCDPAAFSAAEAIEVARQLNVLDPQTGLELLRRLVGPAPEVADEEAVLRVLEIAGAVCQGTRALPALSQLLSHPSQMVRSKAALLMGRVNRNPAWAGQRMIEADRRVRANAIEALWGVDTPEARQAFQTAAQDPDNRVCANAALALYRAGDLEGAAILAEMAAHPEDRFRASAAWAMGETEDPRFLPVVSPLLASPDAVVRHQAFRSLARIRRRAARARQCGELRVLLCGRRRGMVRAAVLDADGEPLTSLAAPQFVLTEGSRIVLSATVRAGGAAEEVALGFAFPREGELFAGAIEACSEFRKGGEHWTARPYQARKDSIRATPLDGDEGSALLLDGLAALSLAMADSEQGLGGAVRRLIPALATAQGARHILAFLNAGEAFDGTGLADRLNAAGICFHAVVLGAAPEAVDDCCRRTGGALETAVEPGDVAGAAASIAASLRGHYTLRYEEAAEERARLEVAVYCESGCGIAATPSR